MINILLVISVLTNVILVIKVVNQKKELNEFYEEDEEEYQNSLNNHEDCTNPNESKLNFLYTYMKNEKEELLTRIKNNNLNYQSEYTNLKKQLNEKVEIIKQQEEQLQNLLTEISSLETIKEQKLNEDNKIEEKTKKTTKRKKKIQENEKEVNEASNKNNSEDDLVNLLFEKEENKKIDSKLAKMQKGELLNYFTNLFNTLRNGNPSSQEVQETYTNAIKDIRDYEEEKQISTGLVTEDGKLKMRSLMNYIDQLQM